MNCNSFRYMSGMTLALVVTLYSVLYFMVSFFESQRSSDRVENVVGPERVTTGEHISTNDFSLMHKNGRDESVHHTFVYTLQGEKLLRESIFDREKILIVSQRLTWFTHSIYQKSLPPWWHPSIPIAHRRLII